MQWLLLSILTTAVFAAEPMGVSSRDGVTTYRVWAPNAKSVEIIGDFNGWHATSNDRLTPDPDTGIWSLGAKRGLPKGAYQFLINGQLARRDPYARAVTPDGGKSLFYDPYAFGWEGVTPPTLPLEDLVIYEMHVGTFNDPRLQDGQPGTFYDAVKRLDQLVWLGVNCVEVMPIHEFNGLQSWGYNPCDLFAVEQTYGGPDGFKTFVKECHRRGLTVHLDIVHNHYGPENLDLLRFDGTGNEKDGGIYFYDGPGINMTPWGPRVKFETPQVRQYVRDNAFMWLAEYRVDGFRWDSTVNIRAYNNGADPIPAGLKMLEDINGEIKGQFPGRWSIAEDSLDTGNFHGSWDYDFHHTVMPVLQKTNDVDRDIGLLAAALVARPSYMQRVVYVDNHDEAGKINGQYRIATDVDPAHPQSEYARKLCGLGAALTLTAPGTPLLFMGNEMQEDGAFHDNRPLDWSKWKINAGLVLLHRDLIRLRRNLDGVGNALKGLQVEVPVADSDKKVIVYWRWDEREPDQRFVVAMNLAGAPAESAIIPFPSAGPWQTSLNSDWTKYGGKSRADEKPFKLDGSANKAQTTLAPYSARIFTTAAAAEAAKAEDAAPIVEAPKPDKPAFSMYASINVVGSFNGSNRTACPLKLKQDYVWEGRVTFTNITETDFRLSANADGRIFWGARDDHDIGSKYTGILRRLGPNINLAGPLDGPCIFRFNEDTLEFTFEPAAPIVIPAPPTFRQWTDVKGNKIEARLVSVAGDAVTLEKRDGRRVHVKLSQLGAEDRAEVGSGR